MADQDHRAGIDREVVLQPERRFEVEVVGRFVEEQQVGLGEQRGGQGHAHPPAARELAHRGVVLLGGEAEAGQDSGGTGRSRVRVDGEQALVDLGDSDAVGGCLGRFADFQFVQQRLALDVGVQHPVDQAGVAVGDILRHPAHANPRPERDAAARRLRFAPDQAEQRGLAGAVAPNQTNALAGGDMHRRALDEDARADTITEIIDVQHGGGDTICAEPGQGPRRVPKKSAIAVIKCTFWRLRSDSDAGM